MTPLRRAFHLALAARLLYWAACLLTDEEPGIAIDLVSAITRVNRTLESLRPR